VKVRASLRAHWHTQLGAPSRSDRPCRRHKPTGCRCVRTAGMPGAHPNRPIVYPTRHSLAASAVAVSAQSRWEDHDGCACVCQPTLETRCSQQSLAPWIIRIRHGTQPDEKAACALRVEPVHGSTHVRVPVVRARVHPPAGAKRPRGSRSVSRLRRGSFASDPRPSPIRNLKLHENL